MKTHLHCTFSRHHYNFNCLQLQLEETPLCEIEAWRLCLKAQQRELVGSGVSVL